MSTLTPKKVGDEMSIYTFRPGAPTLKRELSGTKYVCFDKGHLRRTKKIPEGFVAVPEQVILKYFGTTYTLNIRKMERALEDYAKSPRYRRPTIRSLYLETPSEFELFLKPLDSFYCNYLRASFPKLLDMVYNNDPSVNWKDRVNTLHKGTSAARDNRWNNNTNIYVRLHDFGKLAPISLTKPTYEKPYPTLTTRTTTTPTTTSLTSEQKNEAKDVDMLERCNMGRSRKYRKVLIHMSPWKNCIRTTNPFKSKAYKTAFMSAQHAFELKYVAFKKDIDTKRSAFRAEWKAYKAFKDDQRSVNPGKVSFVERPDPVEFEREWKEFIFGMKQEMKNIEFEPIRGAQADTTKNQILQTRKKVPEISTIPAVKPVQTIAYIPPVLEAPMVLPKISIQEIKPPIITKVHHTKDPELLMIERDLQYSKRIVVK